MLCWGGVTSKRTKKRHGHQTGNVSSGSGRCHLTIHEQRRNTMLFTSIARGVLMLTVLDLTAGFAVGETAPVKQLEMEKEGIKLIGQVEGVARDISYHADHLSSLPSGISNETHYHHLIQIKSLVNEGLRPVLKRLTEI